MADETVYGDICSQDPATLSYLTQAQCGVASLVGRVAGSGERVAVQAAQSAETIAPYTAGAAAAGATASVLAAVSLPLLAVTGTVGVALGDQLLTGGKLRKGLVRAIGTVL